MQQAYIVIRDGQEQIVPLANLTKNELIEIARRLRQEATEHRQHADELAGLGRIDEETDSAARLPPGWYTAEQLGIPDDVPF